MTVYYVMSMWNPYNVVLMRSTLEVNHVPQLSSTRPNALTYQKRIRNRSGGLKNRRIR